MPENTPPDKDLTMIQPDPSVTDVAFDELISSGTNMGSIDSAPITQKKAIQGYQDEAAYQGSISNASVDPELDAYKSMFDTEQSVRARNQDTWVKGAKAVGGGLYQGSLIVLEELGYVADLKGLANTMIGASDASGNWWSNLMKEAQEAGRESEAFKIYEDDPDENSIMAQIFKWQSLEGALSSAVGFGVTGLGAAALVSKLGALKQFAGLAKFTDIAMGNIKAGKAGAQATEAAYAVAKTGAEGAKLASTMPGMMGATRAFTGPLASSLMSNYYMGQMMAVDTYNQSMDSLRDAIEKGDITPYDAQKLANEEAQDVVGLNMALTATSYLRFGNIFKRNNKLNALVENPSALNQLKGLIVKGSPTAFTENVYQEMIQMEQIEDTRVGAGLAREHSADYWSRIGQLALSNRALHAGALGVVGGPIQFAIIQRPLMTKQRAAQRTAFEGQDDAMGFHKTLKETNLQSFKDYQDLTNKAILSGKPEDIELAEQAGMIDEIAKSMRWGVISYLEKDITDIRNLSPDKAKEVGYDDTYQDTADALLNTIAAAKRIKQTHIGYENTGEIVFNRLMAEQVSTSAAKVFARSVETKQAITAKILNHTSLTQEDIGDNFKLKRKKDRFKGVTAEQKTQMLQEEAIKEKELGDVLQDDTTVDNYAEFKQDLSKYRKLSKDLKTQYDRSLTPEYQKDYRDGQNKAAKDINANIAKRNEAIKDVADNKEQSSFISFNKVKDAVIPGTPAELEARAKAMDESIIAEPANLRDDTFTSIDEYGNVANFTKGDLVRSKDGRVFNVLRQMYAGKGDLSSATVPVLLEWNEKSNKTKKGAKPFKLDDISFLRKEIKQYEDGKKFGKRRNWKLYADSDSILRPSSKTQQYSMQTRAENGIVISVNNMEYINNKPKGDLEKTEFAKEYAVHELDNPFVSDYEVEFRLRDEGNTKTFIDVYRVVEGGENYKLTRLDRNANINHTILAKELKKGPVFGSVTAHYTSKRNIVQLRDGEGKKIYNPLHKLRNLPNSNLINGQVWLAQTNISASFISDNPMSVATPQNGKPVLDGKIEVTMPDGTIQTKDIPFKSMHAGDTYALILSPGGHITPVALTSKNLIDIDSKEGNTSYVDDVRGLINKSVRDFMETKIDDLVAYEATSANNEIDNTKTDREAAISNRAEKRTKINSYEKELTTYLLDNAYKVVRPTHFYSNYMENGKWKAHTHLGRKIYNKDFFMIKADISTTGKVVAAIQVRSPYDITKTVNYNVEDAPSEFNFELGKRRKVNSMKDLANPIKKVPGAKDVNLVNELINSTELSTDMNVDQPFAGASATMQVFGSEVQAAGKELADKKRVHFITPFVENMNVVSEVSKADFIKAMDDDFRVLMDSMPADIDQQSVLKYVKNYASSLDVVENIEVAKLTDEVLNDPELPNTPEYLEAVAQITKGGEPTANTPILARSMVLQASIRSKVEAGVIQIKLKDIQGVVIDPSSYGSQKEKITFLPSSPAYHKDYGDVTVYKPLRKGHYYVRYNTNGIIRSARVSAATLYKQGGDFNVLFKRKQELQAAVIGKDAKLIGIKERAVKNAENRLIKAGHLDTPSTEEIVTSKTTKVTSNTDGAAADQNISLANTMAGYTIVAQNDTIIKTFAVTNRVAAINTALIAFNNLKVTKDQKFYDQESTLERDLTAEELKDLYGDILRTIPYTIEELDTLVQEAERVASKESQNALKSMYNFTVAITDYINNAAVKTYEDIGSSGFKFDQPIMSVFDRRAGRNDTTKVAEQYYRLSGLLSNAIVAESATRNNSFFNTDGASPQPSPVTVTKDSSDPKPPQNKEARKDIIAPTVQKQTPTDIKVEMRELLESSVDKATADHLFITYESMLNVMSEAAVIESLRKAIEVEVTKAGGAKMKKGTAVTMSQEAFDAEVTAIKRMLPNVPLNVVENVTDMVNKFGYNAIGAYDKGVRYLVNKAKTGTGYHETFHAVAGLHLRPTEMQDIAKEMGEKKWTLKLEEDLADKFADYVTERNRTKSIGDKVRKFFSDIMAWFNGVRKADITQGIFEKIASGGYASSNNLAYLSNVEANQRSIQSVADFKNSLSSKENVTLQKLLDEERVIIEC